MTKKRHRVAIKRWRNNYKDMQNVYIQVQNKLNGQTTLCLVNNANNHKAFKMTTKGHKMTTKQCLLSCVWAERTLFSNISMRMQECYCFCCFRETKGPQMFPLKKKTKNFRAEEDARTQQKATTDKMPQFALICCVPIWVCNIINIHSLTLLSPQWLVLIEKFTRYSFTATACGLVTMETKL